MNLTPSQTASLNHIRSLHHLKLILLHGSILSGATHQNSDLDIAILRTSPALPIDTLSLLSDLSTALHHDHIDLSDLTTANPLLLQSVASSCQLLSGDPGDLATFELKAFHRYQDYLPYFKLESNFTANYFHHHD